MFTVETKVELFNVHTDDNGEKWYIINQDTWYPADRFTPEEARADYESEQSVMNRYSSTYSAWCD